MKNYALEPVSRADYERGKGEVKYWEGVMRVREENHTGRQIGIGYGTGKL